MKVVWENESAKKGLPFDIGPKPGSGDPPTMAAEEGEEGYAGSAQPLC